MTREGKYFDSVASSQSALQLYRSKHTVSQQRRINATQHNFIYGILAISDRVGVPYSTLSHWYDVVCFNIKVTLMTREAIRLIGQQILDWSQFGRIIVSVRDCSHVEPDFLLLTDRAVCVYKSASFSKEEWEINLLNWLRNFLLYQW